MSRTGRKSETFNKLHIFIRNEGHEKNLKVYIYKS